MPTVRVGPCLRQTLQIPLPVTGCPPSVSAPVVQQSLGWRCVRSLPWTHAQRGQSVTSRPATNRQRNPAGNSLRGSPRQLARSSASALRRQCVGLGSIVMSGSVGRTWVSWGIEGRQLRGEYRGIAACPKTRRTVGLPAPFHRLLTQLTDHSKSGRPQLSCTLWLPLLQDDLSGVPRVTP